MHIIDNGPDLWGSLAVGKTGAAHKYHYGHVLILAGWPGLGASILSAKAALRAGAGLVTVAVPTSKAIAPVLANLPEAIVEKTCIAGSFRKLLASRKRNVALIGPGMGLKNVRYHGACISAALTADTVITVLDADAVTLLADKLQPLQRLLHPRAILTPHEGEFDRIFPVAGTGKLERTLAAAQRLDAIIVHKGAETVIAHPDGRVVRSPMASPWLASAGTGDTLAGIIAGLSGFDTAQTDPLPAIAMAVYMHGLAAHMAGPGLIASDVSALLPQVWQGLS
jgi:hydroxyethylthiazole kinase-like uncharacterized protein yjeF